MSKANSLTRSIVTFLNLSGWKVWRQNNVGIYDLKIQRYRKNPNNLKGVPDVIGFHKDTARFIGVEVKVGKDTISGPQRAFLQELTDSGGIAIVARNFDDFKKEFEIKVKN